MRWQSHWSKNVPPARSHQETEQTDSCDDRLVSLQQAVDMSRFSLGITSDVNKDWTHKDQDKDKDQSHKDKDKDKD